MRAKAQAQMLAQLTQDKQNHVHQSIEQNRHAQISSSRPTIIATTSFITSPPASFRQASPQVGSFYTQPINNSKRHPPVIVDPDKELFIAISKADIEQVRALMFARTASMRPPQSNDGNTPLHLCMSLFIGEPYRYGEIANILLTHPHHPADPNARNSFNCVPLHLAAMKGALSAVKFALSHNIKVMQTKKLNDKISKQYQQQHEQPQQLFDFLATGGPDNESLLHIATSIGHLSMVEFLYKLNFDLHTPNDLGQSARTVAIHSLTLHKILIKYEIHQLFAAIIADDEDNGRDSSYPTGSDSNVELFDGLRVSEDIIEECVHFDKEKKTSLLASKLQLVGTEPRNVSQLKVLIERNSNNLSFLSRNTGLSRNASFATQQNNISNNASLALAIKRENSNPRDVVMNTSSFSTAQESPQIITSPQISFRKDIESKPSFSSSVVSVPQYIQQSKKYVTISSIQSGFAELEELHSANEHPATQRETELSELACDEGFIENGDYLVASKKHVEAITREGSLNMQRHSNRKTDWKVIEKKQQKILDKLAVQHAIPLSVFQGELPFILELIRALLFEKSKIAEEITTTFVDVDQNQSKIMQNNISFNINILNNYQTNANITPQNSSNTSFVSQLPASRSTSPNWMLRRNCSSYNNNKSSVEDQAEGRDSRDEVLRLLNYLHLMHVKFVRMDGVRFKSDTPLPYNIYLLSDFLKKETDESKKRLNARFIPDLLLEVFKLLIRVLDSPGLFSSETSSKPSKNSCDTSLSQPNTFLNQGNNKQPLMQYYKATPSQPSSNNSSMVVFDQSGDSRNVFSTQPLRVTRLVAAADHRSSSMSKEEQNLNPRVSSAEVFVCMERILRFFELSQMKKAGVLLVEVLKLQGKSDDQRYVTTKPLHVKRVNPRGIFERRGETAIGQTASEHREQEETVYDEKFVICHREQHYSEKTLLDFECLQTFAHLSTSFQCSQPLLQEVQVKSIINQQPFTKTNISSTTQNISRNNTQKVTILTAPDACRMQLTNNNSQPSFDEKRSFDYSLTSSAPMKVVSEVIFQARGDLHSQLSRTARINDTRNFDQKPKTIELLNENKYQSRPSSFIRSSDSEVHKQIRPSSTAFQKRVVAQTDRPTVSAFSVQMGYATKRKVEGFSSVMAPSLEITLLKDSQRSSKNNNQLQEISAFAQNSINHVKYSTVTSQKLASTANVRFGSSVRQSGLGATVIAAREEQPQRVVVRPTEKRVTDGRLNERRFSEKQNVQVLLNEEVQKQHSLNSYAMYLKTTQRRGSQIIPSGEENIIDDECEEDQADSSSYRTSSRSFFSRRSSGKRLSSRQKYFTDEHNFV